MQREQLFAEEPREPVIDASEVGNGDRQHSPRGDDVQVCGEDAVDITKVFNEPAREHDIEIAAIPRLKLRREEVRVNHVRRIETVESKHLSVQFRSSWSVLHAIAVETVGLVHLNQMRAGRAANLQKLGAGPAWQVPRVEHVPHQVLPIVLH